MTDVNTDEYQSASSRLRDEDNSSFMLNQSNVPMDVDIDDDDDDEFINSSSLKFNGHNRSSPSDTIENGNSAKSTKEDVFHLGNPVLNKSFDVLPQIKDDDTPSADSIVDNIAENIDTLDATVELPDNNDELDDKLPQDFNFPKSIRNVHPSTSGQSLLSNQFSLEYPYVVPQPVENVLSNSVETVTTLTKNMKLNMNRTSEVQELSTPTSTAEKTFDTNTFVLKKKERRKATTPASENSFNTVPEDTPPDMCNKQSPFTTPSGSMDAAMTSRPATTISSFQQPSMDPMRIM